MKFTVQTKEFAKGLSRIIGAVPKRSPMPILSNVKLTANGFHITACATDMDTYVETNIQAEIEAGGNGVLLPAQRLYETVSAITSAEVTIAINENFRATITTDSANYKITGVSAEEYPTRVSSDEECPATVLPTKQFQALIDSVSFAVSTDEFRPAMCGVKLEIQEQSIQAVATDGFRVAFSKRSFEEPISEKATELIVAPNPVKGFLKYVEAENVRLKATKHHIILSDEVTTVFLRLIDEVYPNYNSIVPRSNEQVITTRREYLLSTLKRIALYANATTRLVRFNILDTDNQALVIESEDIDTGSEAKENVPIEFNGEPIEIGFNAALLREGLQHIDAEEIKITLSTPLRPAMILPINAAEGTETWQILMPVRLNN